MSEVTALRREEALAASFAPIIDHRGKHAEVHFQTLVFGRPKNVSLARLADNLEHQQHLGTIAQYMGVRKVLAPVPGFNAVLALESTLTEHIHVSANTVVLRNKSRDGDADAVQLMRGQAYAVSPSNCVTIVATNGTKLYAAHAGRWSLFTDNFASGERAVERRRHESVVDMLFGHLFTCEHAPSDIRVWIYGGVRGEDFPHPLVGEHAKTNSALLTRIVNEHGTDAVERDSGRFLLDLPRIIELQFIKLKVPEENISLEHARLDPKRAWTNGSEGTERNLVFVARTK